MRGQCAVEGFARRKAVVASAATFFGRADLLVSLAVQQHGPTIFFPKIREQFHAPAIGALGVVDHLLQLFARYLLFLRIWFFVNEHRLFHRVAGTEQQNTFARKSVAPGAASFLIIALDVFRQIVVDDEADVRFVDAHAKGNGRADHAHVIAQKKFLMLAAFLRRESGVIRFGLHAVFGKIRGHALGGFARHAIHDAAFLRSRAEKLQQLIVRFVFGENAIGQVRTVETGDVTTWFAQFQMRDDVFAHAASRGGGERHERDVGKMFSQFGNLAVFGTEIVSPFADAMRLVNGDEPDAPLLQIG